MPVLADLARTATVQQVRLAAAPGLLELRQTALASEVFAELARTATDDHVRLGAVSGVLTGALLADTRHEADSAPAERHPLPEQNHVDVLADLARHATESWLRASAMNMLSQIGPSAYSALTELVSTGTDEARVHASIALVSAGRADLALVGLADLARSATDAEARLGALSGLERASRGAHHEAALDALADLARTATDERVRVEGAIALVQPKGPGSLADEFAFRRAVGSGAAGARAQTGVDVLADLARTATDEVVRARAAQELGELGRREFALDIFAELAQSANSEQARFVAAQMLRELGEGENRTPGTRRPG